MEVGMNKIVKKEVESSCEYILPDYMGDIKKILYSRAKGMPGGKYVSGADAEHSGVVEYEVLYADAENRLTAVTASSDYAATFSCADGELRDSFHKCKVAGASVRTTGPRKLSFKSVVEVSSAMITEGDGEENLCEGIDAEQLEKSTTRIKSEVYEHIATAEREIAEEIGRINGVGRDDVEIVLTDCDVRISDIRASERGIAVKGEVIVEMIRRVEDTPPYSTKKSYPFEHTVERGELPADIKLTANGIASSVTVGVYEEGEDSVISVNAIVEINVYGAYNAEKTVVTDAYLIDHETENTYSDLDYTTLADVINTEFYLDERVKLSAIGLSSVRDILIAGADVVKLECVPERHSIKIGGEIQISGVACEINGDNAIVYTPYKHVLPFAYNVNNSSHISANDSVECELCAHLTDATIDADEICFKITVCATVKSSFNGKIRCLSSLTACDEEFLHPSASRITVYYPLPDQTLFDIAKKHHTTCEKLCIDNSISIDTAVGSDIQLPRKLIIK